MTPGAAAERAALSHGRSDPRLHAWVATLLTQAGAGGTLLDVGCGAGGLSRSVSGRFQRYLGCDLVAYDGFPRDGATFVKADLDHPPYPLEDGAAETVVSVETIEHLENPRAFVRALVRAARPGGWVIVTTPNQLSLLSRATLVARGEHNAFRDASYPAHITALLEVDLRRIAAECGLEEVSVEFSHSGRVAGSGRHYPGWLSRLWPRGLSDNLLLAGRKPRG